VLSFAAFAKGQLPYNDPSLPIPIRVQDLLGPHDAGGEVPPALHGGGRSWEDSARFGTASSASNWMRNTAEWRCIAATHRLRSWADANARTLDKRINATNATSWSERASASP
jgi:hypothetical protein